MADLSELVRDLVAGRSSFSGQTLSGHGRSMYSLAERLFPICRSISGPGLRETLSIVSESIPLEIHEVETGTPVFDWTIPNEWTIRDAFIETLDGRRVVDFQDNNLHVVSYSAPVDRVMPLSELKERLHTLPEHPDWIPYRTTYYNEDWGFCLSQNHLDSLADVDYHVVVDAELSHGALTYGEALIKGRSEKEILFFAHCCHPSLANDNLSGVVVLATLGSILRDLDLHYSVRLLFAPATIGSIAWMARNEDRLTRIKAGLVASVLGDQGHFRYKLTRRGNTLTDRTCRHLLKALESHSEILEFSPWGYDERQFGSPGIDLPIGRLTRSPNGAYPEYHTSADDMSLMTPESLAGSLLLFLQFIDCLTADRVFENQHPKGEPQLGKRGLYRKMGGFQDIGEAKLAMLWVLNQSDGSHSLLDTAEKSGLSYALLRDAAETLIEADLLRAVGSD